MDHWQYFDFSPNYSKSHFYHDRARLKSSKLSHFFNIPNFLENLIFLISWKSQKLLDTSTFYQNCRNFQNYLKNLKFLYSFQKNYSKLYSKSQRFSSTWKYIFHACHILQTISYSANIQSQFLPVLLKSETVPKNILTFIG